jgi:uncharacterized protein (DUF1697 family)
VTRQVAYTARLLRTDFFVLIAAEWEAVIARNPFPDQAREDSSHLLVMFLKDAADHTATAKLQKAIAGREVVRAAGRHLYAVYPDGIGRSRLTTAVIEKALGTLATGSHG